MRPQRLQPTRLPRPWDSSGKNTGVGCHFLLQCMKVKSEREVAQSCPTPSDPMNCSPPGSSIYGIFQARVLEWVAIAFSALSSTSCFRGWIMPLPTLLSPLMQMWILYGNGLIYTSRICPLLHLMGMTHKIKHHSIQIIIIKWTHLCKLCLLPETTFSNFFLSLSHPFPRVHHPPDTQHFR